MLTSVDQGFHKDMIVITEELEHAIKALKSGKSPGHDNLRSEHFKYVSCKLIVILSICITYMFIHNYIPDGCIKTLMLPLVNYSAGNIADANNYRPISQTTIVPKLIELIILNRYERSSLVVINNLASKRIYQRICVSLNKLSITISVNLVQHSVCFIDASKAFDRVNHDKLFGKIIKCGVPVLLYNYGLVFPTNFKF